MPKCATAVSYRVVGVEKVSKRPTQLRLGQLGTQNIMLPKSRFICIIHTLSAQHFLFIAYLVQVSISGAQAGIFKTPSGPQAIVCQSLLCLIPRRTTKI